MSICFLIFAHTIAQDKHDIDDDNTSRFCDIEHDFLINHPFINHSAVFTKHKVGVRGKSDFVFGAFRAIINKLTYKTINKFDFFLPCIRKSILYK